MRPFACKIGRRVHHVDCRRFAAPIAAHQVVAAVAVEIGDGDLMTFGHAVEDDVAIPLRSVLRVDHDLVAVPRLDRGEKALAVERADANVARAEARRLVRVVARRQDLGRPFHIRAAAARAVQRDALERRDEQLIALVAVPLHGAHAVDDAGDVLGDYLPLPVVLAVEEERRLVLIVRRSWSIHADERRVDQFLLAVAVDVGPDDVMRRRELVDLLRLPRLLRIAFVLHHPDEPFAGLGRHREAVLVRDLGNAVAVDIGGGEVDDARHAAGHDVALPCGVLVPRHLRNALARADDVRLAVFVHVDSGDRVAAGELGLDVVRAELDLRRRRGRAGERCRRKNGSGEDSQFHGADYLTRERSPSGLP